MMPIYNIGLGLEYSNDWFDSMPEVTQSARFFDEVSLEQIKLQKD